jgi:hypothetical protein
MADRYLVWGLVSIIVVLSVVFAVADFRRRIERERSARFHFGVGFVDDLTGKELSPRAQAIVFAISIGIGALALLVGLSVLLLRRGLVS